MKILCLSGKRHRVICRVKKLYLFSRFVNVAKYYLGKVKRERSWPAVSAFAVRDLRGGPQVLQGLFGARG